MNDIMNIEQTSHRVFLAKWEKSYIKVKIITLFSIVLRVTEGTADELYCSFEEGHLNKFNTRETCDNDFYDFVMCYRHCKKNLNYGKFTYHNELDFSSYTDFLDAFNSPLEYLYLCQLSEARDFHYVEPVWYNGR